MKSVASVLVALACAQAALSVVPLSKVPHQTSAQLLPHGYVVELESQNGQLGSRDALSPHEKFYDMLQKRGTSWKVRQEFNHPGLFVGTSVELTNDIDIAKLAGAPGVVAIRPIILVPPPRPTKKIIVKGASDPNVPPDTQSSHKMIGVDKLHAQGILGKGVKIGIIDTGIDYTHPLLGGAIGPGHKVIGGFDFVGDAYDGTNTPMPDPDPLDQCNGHGTHVAGIMVGNPGNEFNISGIAYEANVASYRVFGCNGSVTDDIIVQALLRGVSEGMDILTMSLGGVDGWTESSSSVVSSRISAQGKVVTIAAGNDGGFGGWYTSSPGNAINSISCASVDNIMFPVQTATVSGVTHAPIVYDSLFALNVTGTLPIFATSTDTTVPDDACNPLPDSTPDLSGFVVIIRRGSCSFVQKLTNAAAKGMKQALIYNNVEGLLSIAVGDFTATLITPEDGAFLVQQFAAKAPLQLTFPQTGGSANFPDPHGGLISTFTSYGPTYDMFFKPAVAAPGGNILSLEPVPLGSFGVESGTSMATPATAASAALVLSVRGNNAQTARAMRDLLQTTAQPVGSTATDSDPFQTLMQQGAGLINTFNAVHTQTIVTPGQLLLNDTTHGKNIQSFTIFNKAFARKTFQLTHVPAGTMTSITAGDIFAADGPVPLTTDFATVRLSKNSVTLGPGQSTTVFVFVTPPKSDDTTLPVFSGWIQITSGAEQLRVAYMGVAATLKNKQVFDNTDEVFGFNLPALLDSTGNPQAAPTNYTFVGADFPTILYRLAFGTPAFKVDLVDTKENIPTTFTKRDLFSGWFPHAGKGGSFSQIKTIGPLAEFDNIPRSSDSGDPTTNGFSTIALSPPQFANGTNIPNGQYRILLRALRVTGDPTREEDYESWVSPAFGVAV